MSGAICLFGGPVFDGDNYMSEGAVVFNSNKVIKVTANVPVRSNIKAIDVRGNLIAPGLVDLHSDALEKYVEVRPGIFFDPEMAVINMDRRAAACGITSFCHAVSFAGEELGLRSCQRAENLVRLIRFFGDSTHSSVRHHIHARLEVGVQKATLAINRLIDDGLIDILSIMDHTPGQGQFKTFQSFIDFYEKTYKFEPGELMKIIDSKTKKKENAWLEITELMERASQSKIPLLSHDDDTVKKVDLVRRHGAIGCEFPITMNAAKQAKKRGMSVFMGAPNIVRGRSTNNHLKALDAVSENLCDGLISDYYPECLLQAPFIISDKIEADLSAVMAMVTRNPGGFLKPKMGVGRLREGYPADVIVVDHHSVWKTVFQTWVNGRCVYRSSFD